MKTNVVKGFLFLITLLLVVVGCQDKDYYDETNNRPSQADLFPENVVISDDFDWSTTKTVELSVSVDDKYNGAYYYIVEVYDANPLYNTGANLLGAGVAKSGKDFVSNIVATTSTDVLYVQQTDPTGEKTVTSVQFNNETALSVSFKAATQLSDFVKSASAGKRATSITVPATTANAIDVTSAAFSGSVNSGNSYVIPVGKEYRGAPSFDWNSGGTIFVEGTWTIPSNVNLIYYTVVVQQGGTIKFENENTSFDLGGQLIIASGAKFNKANITLTFYGGGPSRKAITNYGTLNAKNISVANSCELNNYGDLVAEAITALNSFSTIILNEGSLTTGNLTFTGSGGSFSNNCTFVVTNTLNLRGTTVNINEGALISASAIDCENSTINLLGNAMLVATTAKFNAGMTKIYGQGVSKSLVKITTVTYNTWDTFSAYNNVVLEFQNIIDNGGRNTAYAPAVIVKNSAASVNISATSCNGNGNTVVPGAPIERALPIIQLGTYSYAFEDNWPSYGDYDMNDFVGDVALIREQNTNNKLVKLTIKTNLRAVGATKHLAAAVQLKGIKSEDVKSVTYSNSSLVGKNFILNSSGVEAGQTYAVIPLCDDVHQAFGLSTPSFINTTDAAKLNPVELYMTVEFKSPVNLLTNDDLNVFIVTAGYKGTRTEIHLNGQLPTDKANQSQFSSANLKEGQPYRSHENLIWGLCISGAFDYPVESEKITDDYPLFKNWAESNGTESVDWYKKSN